MTTETTLSWLGSQKPFLDTKMVQSCGPLVLGTYGGMRASGAKKNEDAALLWHDEFDLWELALVCDAHYGAASATLMVALMTREERALRNVLDRPSAEAIPQIQDHMVRLMRDPATLRLASQVTGECSWMIVVRHGGYVWWMAIGDCMGYLINPELASLGQYGLNQRVFFQWVGQRNTFAQAVPGYSTGTQALPPHGRTVLAVLSDGIIECGDQPLANPAALAGLLMQTATLEERAHALLDIVESQHGRDSATVVLWERDAP